MTAQAHLALGALLDVTASVSSTFDCFEPAEEEIAAAKLRRPRAARKLHGAFKLLCPTGPLHGKAEAVYRAHVRELLERVVRGADTRPGTDAECLCALSDVSLKAPLGVVAAALADRLGKRVLGLEGRVTPEPWKGACNEALEGLRRQLAVPTRR